MRLSFVALASCIGCGSIPADVTFTPDGAATNTNGGDGATPVTDGGAVDSGTPEPDAEADAAPTMCGSKVLPAGGTCCSSSGGPSQICFGNACDLKGCRSDCEQAQCNNAKVCCRLTVPGETPRSTCIVLGDSCP